MEMSLLNNEETSMTFDFNGHELDVILINNLPYFIGKDVCEILLYKNVRDAISRHCKGVVKHDILSNGGMQKVSVIPERDLYRLIMRSKLPQAVKFEEWVTDVVLPQIMRTGKFDSRPNPYLNYKESDWIRLCLDKTKKVEALREEKKALECRLEESSEKVETLDLIVQAEDQYSITQAAKLLGVKPHTLCANLDRMGYTYTSGKVRTPYQQLIDRGILGLKYTGEMYGGKYRYSTVVTSKGIDHLRRKGL